MSHLISNKLGWEADEARNSFVRMMLLKQCPKSAYGVQCHTHHEEGCYHEDNPYRVEYCGLHGASSLNLLTPYTPRRPLPGSRAGDLGGICSLINQPPCLP